MVKREGREKGRGYESLRKQLTLTNQNKKLGTMAMLTTEGYSMMVYYKKRFIKDGGIGGGSDCAGSRRDISWWQS